SASCHLAGLRIGDAAMMMAFRTVIVAVLAGPALATVLARTKLRQSSGSWQDFSPCSCAQCLGEHRNEGGAGSVGFQCFPKSSSLADCRQSEDMAARVVQSADVVSYDRYCLYTCKPLLTDEIKPVVDCAHLDHHEITDLAQSPTSNGREIVYEAHPLARVGPISQWVPLPEASATNPTLDARSSDPVGAIRGTFSSLRRQEAAAPGVSPYNLPDAAKAPPLCVCHCGNRVNRFRQTESDGIVYPKPKQVKLPLSVTSSGNPAVQPEPLQPPMPPPPPADLPPPSMPLGLFPGQELPPLPEAPLEITAPLSPSEIGLPEAGATSEKASEKPVSFLQEVLGRVYKVLWHLQLRAMAATEVVALMFPGSLKIFQRSTEANYRIEIARHYIINVRQLWMFLRHAAHLSDHLRGVTLDGLEKACSAIHSLACSLRTQEQHEAGIALIFKQPRSLQHDEWIQEAVKCYCTC
ncbi:FUBP3, partial [Symbiodinium pilosum]